MKFVGSGKVKDIYDLEDGTLLFQFSNRISAFDVKFKEEIPKKGEVLCKFAEFWFKKLQAQNHFVKRYSVNEIIVKKMKMLPIECVVRGYFYGSLITRWKNGQVTLSKNTDTRIAAKLPEPLFDPTTKSEHDIPINKTKALEMHLVTETQFDWLSKTSISIYEQMAQIADSVGFILADLKLEFGIIDGQIILGDSLGPDEYRLWLKDSYSIGKIQDPYDKQLLRDWLVKEGYFDKFEDARSKGLDPLAPSIPPHLVNEISKRYVLAYEKFTGTTL